MKKIFIISVCLIFVISCSSEKKVSLPKRISVKAGASIQKAIDKASPGDLIILETGTYNGDVVVSTNDLTIRGKDRNNTIIDGKYKQDNGFIIAANGVRIENLTVQKFRTNGILFQGGYESDTTNTSTPDVLDRYKVQYVNALNNGLYGIYAFSSKNGVIANTYTKANADAGIYIGQCKPCNALVTGNIAEDNGLGFQGANASKELYIFTNNFSNNRAGIHLLSETKETKSPQEGVVVKGNLASKNNNDSAPTTTPDLYGFGIVIAGGNDNIVENNRTEENIQVGIALVENNAFLPSNNSFKGNFSRNNGSPFGFDLAYLISGRPDVMSLGNCFENNSYSSSSIDKIQTVLPCTGAAPGPFKSQPLKNFKVPDAPSYDSISVATLNQENMKKINSIPGKLKKISKPDLSQIGVPSAE